MRSRIDSYVVLPIIIDIASSGENCKKGGGKALTPPPLFADFWLEIGGVKPFPKVIQRQRPKNFRPPSAAG